MHFLSSFFATFLHLFFLWRCKHHIRSSGYVPLKGRNAIENIVGVLCVISLIFTGYYKISTRKGLFILNPCHIALLTITIMLLAKWKKFTFTAGTSHILINMDIWSFSSISYPSFVRDIKFLDLFILLLTLIDIPS